MRKSFGFVFYGTCVMALIAVILLCVLMVNGYSYGLAQWFAGFGFAMIAGVLAMPIAKAWDESEERAAKAVTTPEEIYVHYGHLVIRATVLDMAGPMCIIKAQGRVAPAWLTGDKWVIYHQPIDILDDPRMSEPAHLDDPYDGVL